MAGMNSFKRQKLLLLDLILDTLRHIRDQPRQERRDDENEMLELLQGRI